MKIVRPRAFDPSCGVDRVQLVQQLLRHQRVFNRLGDHFRRCPPFPIGERARLNEASRLCSSGSCRWIM